MNKCSRIDLEPGFFALLCAYFYFDPANTFEPFCMSVLLHEAGHLLCLRAFGARVYRIRLSCCGAVICTDALSYGRELVAAASGPAVNMVLFFVCMRGHPLAALVNAALFAYNMLPIYPLDGGRILRALLHLMLSDGTAASIERWIVRILMAALGGGTVYCACVLHLGLWPVIVFGLLLARIAGAVRPVQSFSQFSVDKSRSVC